MADQLHVAIVGAGVAGLHLAQGLKKHGISCTVYEAELTANFDRSREWGMSLQWALPMLPTVLPDDLIADLPRACCDPHYRPPEQGNYMPVYNAESGEHVKDIPLVKFLRVSRSKLRRLLCSGLDVQYGKTFNSGTFSSDGSGVETSFEDGTAVRATLLIAADGANSTVRRSLFPAPEGDAQQIPYRGVNMHVRYTSAATATHLRSFLAPTQCIGAHPRGYWLWLSVQDVPDPQAPETWSFHLQWTWKVGESTQTLATLDLEKLQTEATECFGEPFRTAWRAIPPGTKVPANRISIWPPRRAPEDAFDGRFALVGDAAHAMSFHRGQGLNHGVADACQLVTELVAVQKGDQTQREAVLAYEADMIKRAGEEVEVGRVNTEMMHDWARMRDSPFMQRGGDKNR